MNWKKYSYFYENALTEPDQLENMHFISGFSALFEPNLSNVL